MTSLTLSPSPPAPRQAYLVKQNRTGRPVIKKVQYHVAAQNVSLISSADCSARRPASVAHTRASGSLTPSATVNVKSGHTVKVRQFPSMATARGLSRDLPTVIDTPRREGRRFRPYSRLAQLSLNVVRHLSSVLPTRVTRGNRTCPLAKRLVAGSFLLEEEARPRGVLVARVRACDDDDVPR